MNDSRNDSLVCKKGIVLAGGRGTRLYPLTAGVNKHLLPVHDKPMIYYPLSVLMLAGIREILLITNPDDLNAFQNLLGDGSRLGLSIQYAIQPRPDGIADAFRIGRAFIGQDHVALILGDNLFYGSNLQPMLAAARAHEVGATTFAYAVQNPSEFCVVEIDDTDAVLSIEEKPVVAKSNLAVVGLYFYDNQVVDIAANLAPSKRGELEIADINIEYLRRGQLRCEPLGREVTWLDCGTFESLEKAVKLVSETERQSGSKIACLEEIAHTNGFVL